MFVVRPLFYLDFLALNHLWSSGIRDPHNWSDRKETPSWLVRGHATMTSAHSAGSVSGHLSSPSRAYRRVPIPPIRTIDRLVRAEEEMAKQIERGENQRVHIHERVAV